MRGARLGADALPACLLSGGSPGACAELAGRCETEHLRGVTLADLLQEA